MRRRRRRFVLVEGVTVFDVEFRVVNDVVVVVFDVDNVYLVVTDVVHAGDDVVVGV